MTASLQQLLAISGLLTSVEKAIEAENLSSRNLEFLQEAAQRVRDAFKMPHEGRSEVKRQA